MAVPNFGTGGPYISVLRNTSTPGTISFATKVRFSIVSKQTTLIAIGDLDGDGKLDMVTTNYMDFNKVTVFRNTSSPGNISFASKIDFATGSWPYSVEINDLNGDGKPDIAVANDSNSSISVLRNTSTPGNISFSSKYDYKAGTNSRIISIGDIDGDGKPDMAVNDYYNQVYIYRNLMGLSMKITSFNPTSAGTGSTITIKGNNFSAVSEVYFGGVPALSFTVFADTMITAVVGYGASGSVLVVYGCQTATKSGFQFIPLINSITGNQLVCPNNLPDSLKGMQPTGGNGSYSFLWITSIFDSSFGFMPANGINDQINYKPDGSSLTRWFRRVVTSGLAIDTSNAIKIEVSKTNIDFTINNISQCQKTNKFTFTDKTTISSGSYIRLWDFGNGVSDTSASKQIKYDTAGTYNIKLKTNTNFNCFDSLIKTVTVNPSPIAGVISGLDSNLLKGTAYVYSINQQTNHTYKWTVTNGNITAGQGTNTITVKWLNNGSGNLKVVLTNSSSCKDSTSINVKIGKVGLNDIKIFSNLELYPNPNNGNFIISTNVLKEIKANISLINIIGDVVWSTNTELLTGYNNVQVAINLESGIYLLKLSDGDAYIFKKVIIWK
jgi:hypothetical protein